MVGCISAKQNYFIDEIYSYGLANNKEGLELSVSEFYKYEPASDLYKEYMAVNENERFDYGMVWENQHKDVHPPLYYVLLHTISSLFPGEFSIWFAGIINIVFGLATLFVLRKIIRLFDNPLVVCDVISLLFVLSPGILSAISFFRMYIVAMFEVTLFTYLFLKKLKAPSKAETIKTYTPMLVCAVLGALTHYYCIIYIVLISFLYGMYLLYKKQWENVKKFVCSMLIAGIVSCLIFPYVLSHMLLGNRGKESISNFLNISDLYERIAAFWGIMNRQLFAGLLNYMIIGVVIFAMLKMFLNKQEKVVNKKYCIKELVDNFEVIGYVFLILPTLGYFLIVSKVGAFLTDRYIFPIYALVLVGTICLIARVLRKLLSPSKYVICVIVLSILLVICGWCKAEWKYLYLNYPSVQTEIEQYQEEDCIVIYSENWQIPSLYLDALNYKSMTFINKEDFNELLQSDFLASDKFVIAFTGFDNTEEEYLQKINLAADNEFEVTTIGTYFYTASYCLEKQ